MFAVFPYARITPILNASYRQKHLSGGGETDSSLIYKSFDYSSWGGGGDTQDDFLSKFPFQLLYIDRNRPIYFEPVPL